MSKELKLTSLSETEMKKVSGGNQYMLDGDTGNWCGCACAYAGSGGSSSYQNASANCGAGLFSPGM